MHGVKFVCVAACVEDELLAQHSHHLLRAFITIEGNEGQKPTRESSQRFAEDPDLSFFIHVIFYMNLSSQGMTNQ